MVSKCVKWSGFRCHASETSESRVSSSVPWRKLCSVAEGSGLRQGRGAGPGVPGLWQVDMSKL